MIRCALNKGSVFVFVFFLWMGGVSYSKILKHNNFTDLLFHTTKKAKKRPQMTYNYRGDVLQPIVALFHNIITKGKAPSQEG